jgi:hypothetical protein
MLGRLEARFLTNTTKTNTLLFHSHHAVNQHPLHGNVGERKWFPGQTSLGRAMRGALTVGGPLLMARARAISFVGFWTAPIFHIAQSPVLLCLS